MGREELSTEAIEMLIFFCTRTITNLSLAENNMPYVKFVFSYEDLEEIIKYLENIKYTNGKHWLSVKMCVDQDQRLVTKDNVTNAINILKNIKKEYNSNRQRDAIYIEIPNYKEFFNLLDDIRKTYDENKNIATTSQLIETIWLRMGVTDITNINLFLKRQLAFIKNDDFLGYYPISFGKFGDYDLLYRNDNNTSFYETNRYLRIYLSQKEKTHSLSFWDELDSPEKKYDFPAIHYSLVKEDGKPTCYIYGIQNLGYEHRDKTIKTNIHDEIKKLRNKYVSPDFIIALTIFVEIMESIGISIIKIPLLQVFNYQFHEYLSNNIRNEYYYEYSHEKRQDLETRIRNNEENDEIREYQRVKQLYSHYVDKEDLISKNKTERLVYTAMIMSEQFGNIDFLNEPFIQDDTLICRINCCSKCRRLIINKT